MKLTDYLGQIAIAKDDMQRSQLIRILILSLGSETPDNIECANNIETGALQRDAHTIDERTENGLRLAQSKIALSDIAHSLENLDTIPDQIQAEFPSLNLAEWQAFNRLTTLLYIALEDADQTT